MNKFNLLGVCYNPLTYEFVNTDNCTYEKYYCSDICNSCTATIDTTKTYLQSNLIFKCNFFIIYNNNKMMIYIIQFFFSLFINLI